MIRPEQRAAQQAISIPRESGDDPNFFSTVDRNQECIPRESGDDPWMKDGWPIFDEYSPRERG